MVNRWRFVALRGEQLTEGGRACSRVAGLACWIGVVVRHQSSILEDPGASASLPLGDAASAAQRRRRKADDNASGRPRRTARTQTETPEPTAYVMIGMMRMATMLATLIIGLIAGP
ncbi:MAG: hypothetical protein ACXVFM_20110, partial [Solirubrobacteraceae bacterium]